MSFSETSAGSKFRARKLIEPVKTNSYKMKGTKGKSQTSMKLSVK